MPDDGEEGASGGCPHPLTTSSPTPFGWLQQNIAPEMYIYRPEVVVAAVLGMLVLLVWFSQFPYRRTQEETLQESIEQDADAVHSLAG